MCYALHFQYADQSNIWVPSALLAKHNHHSVYVVYVYACVRSFWLTLCISGLTLLGTVEIFIAKSIFDYSLGRPAWAHLHTTLTQMSQWWDESLMVYTWILKWCGGYVAPSFILYLHTSLHSPKYPNDEHLILYRLMVQFTTASNRLIGYICEVDSV